MFENFFTNLKMFLIAGKKEEEILENNGEREN